MGCLQGQVVCCANVQTPGRIPGPVAADTFGGPPRSLEELAVLLRTRPETARRSTLQSLAERATPAQLAAGRTGAGVVMIVRPRTLPRLMGVDSATAARTGWVVQMLGAREIALGVGTLAALRRGDRGARLWLAVGVLADGVDALAVAGALVKGRVSKGTGLGLLAVAGSAVALGVHALQEDEADSSI
jgi:hypothetical protein